jgi:hypothetical protein
MTLLKSKLKELFPNKECLEIESALSLSNNNVDTASLILMSSRHKTKSDLEKKKKELIKSSNSFFYNTCIFQNILCYFDICEKNKYIKINKKLNNYFKDSVNYDINKYKSLYSYLENEVNNTPRDSLESLNDTNNSEKVLKDLTDNNIIKYLPEEYTIFLKLIKYKPFASLLELRHIFLEKSNFYNEEIENYQSRKSKCIGLITEYAGMGHYFLLSYLSDYNNENRFFISLMGGSNGWDCDINYKKYNNNEIKDLKLLNFEDALKSLIDPQDSELSYLYN